MKREKIIFSSLPKRKLLIPLLFVFLSLDGTKIEGRWKEWWKKKEGEGKGEMDPNVLMTNKRIRVARKKDFYFPP